MTSDPFWTLTTASGDQVSVAVWRRVDGTPGYVHVFVDLVESEGVAVPVLELTPSETAELCFALSAARRRAQ